MNRLATHCIPTISAKRLSMTPKNSMLLSRCSSGRSIFLPSASLNHELAISRPVFSGGLRPGVDVRPQGRAAKRTVGRRPRIARCHGGSGFARRSPMAGIFLLRWWSISRGMPRNRTIRLRSSSGHQALLPCPVLNPRRGRPPRLWSWLKPNPIPSHREPRPWPSPLPGPS